MIKAATLTATLMLCSSTAFAQARQTAATETDAIAALTAEVRALRTELAQAARSSLRLQLLTARIQAQEQRIIYLDRQRAEAMSRRADHEDNMQSLRNQLQMFSATVLDKMPPEQRRDMEAMIGQHKMNIEEHERRLGDLRAQEVDAENALAQEQARWGDLNNRLEELERSLR